MIVFHTMADQVGSADDVNDAVEYFIYTFYNLFEIIYT